VGGFRAMVEAVAMRTFGLGGDSEVSLAEGGLEPRLKLGPRRIVPLSLAAHLHGAGVVAILERQLGANPGRLDGRLAFRSGLSDRCTAGLSAAEAQLYEKIGEEPRPVDGLVVYSTRQSTLTRLGAQRIVHYTTYTPY